MVDSIKVVKTWEKSHRRGRQGHQAEPRNEDLQSPERRDRDLNLDQPVDRVKRHPRDLPQAYQVISMSLEELVNILCTFKESPFFGRSNLNISLGKARKLVFKLVSPKHQVHFDIISEKESFFESSHYN